MRVRFLIVTILIIVLAVFGLKMVWISGRTDASDLLLDSAKKVHHTDYSGLVETSTVYYGKELKGLTRVYHKGSGDRMEYLSAPAKGTVVVATGSETVTYHPHNGRVVVSPTTAQAEEEKKIRLLLSNYSAEFSGEAVVAGRPTSVVDIIPKRHGNPSKRMWIDKKTYIILRQEDRSANGTLKSRMAFKEISYSPNIPASKMEVPAGVKKSPTVVKAYQPLEAGTLSKQLNMKVTKPGYVPNGYQFAGYQLYRCQCNCNHSAAHLRYTDGLNSISVFETPLDVSCAGSMCKMQGMKKSSGCDIGDCRQAQVGRIKLNDKSVMVIADLPQKEIKRIARSIK